MAEGIFFVKASNINNYKTTDIAFDSRLDHIYTKAGADPSHIGTYTHVFGDTPPNGTFTILEVNHGFDYIPSALVRISEEGSDLQQYLPTVLTNSYFDPLPIVKLQEWIFYYYVDEISLKIFYRQTLGNEPVPPAAENPYKNTTQQIYYEIFANPGHELVTL